MSGCFFAENIGLRRFFAKDLRRNEKRDLAERKLRLSKHAPQYNPLQNKGSRRNTGCPFPMGFCLNGGL